MAKKQSKGRDPRGCLPLPLLAGQSAIVTGGSSGIGAAVCKGLAEAGANVVVNYHSGRDAAEEVVREIHGLDITHAGRAIAVKGDVSKEKDVVRLFDTAVKEWGAVEILVANAGIQKDAPLTEMSEEDWRKVIDVNLTGQFLAAREAVKRFKKQGPRKHSAASGKIICMSSVHEIIPWARRVNYAASKGGVSLLMKSIAQEVAGDRIRVNSIAPGAIKTPINEDAWSDPESRRELLELIPYGRIGEPEDVARVAVWLASDYADYITGETILVDGGMSLYPGFAGGKG